MEKFLRDFSKKVLGGLKSTDGIPAAELGKAERRLGVQFPETLRKFYTVAGNHKVIARGFDVVLPPKALYIKDDRLVFLRENQSVVFWGIQLSKLRDDPPVYQGNHAERKWHKDADRLSAFLVGVACWQAVQNLPYIAQGTVGKGFMEKIGKVFTYADPEITDKTNDMTGYYGDGIAVAISRSEKKFLVGAKKQDVLKKFGTSLKTRLNFL